MYVSTLEFGVLNLETLKIVRLSFVPEERTLRLLYEILEERL
jgi:hypothetical protein